MGHAIDNADATWVALDRVVAEVQRTRAQIARLQAAEARLLTDAADVVLAREQQRRAAGRRTAHDLPLREVTSELGAAMRLSDRAVQARMSAASTLVERFPKTLRALRKGRIDFAHASAITDSGASIGDELMRAEYERILLEAAKYETPPRLRAIALVVAARIDPEMAAQLQGQAIGQRRVRVIDLDDGMARLLADLPAVLAHAIFDRLTQMADEELRSEAAARAAAADEVNATPDATGANDGDGRVLAGAAEHPAVGASDVEAGVMPAAVDSDATLVQGDPAAGKGGLAGLPRGAVRTGPDRDVRSLDQLRADIFADLVLTGAPTAHGEGDALASIRAEVQITIPVLTAMGVSDEPALLEGYGPIDRETACALAAEAPGWDRVMFHPHTGLPLAVDRYRPSAELRRFLRARDERCRFPGCTRSPARCDVDHTIDRAKGGVTAEGNLANFCRRHHTVKHATAWRVQQVGGGILEWTSLTGRRYLDKPPPTVRFVPSREWAEAVATASGSDAPF